MRRLLAPLLAVTALGTTLPGATMLGVPAAQAAPGKGPVFGLRAGGNPKLGYFVYGLAPGGGRTGRVIVSNTGTTTGTVKLFPADATTGSTSGTVYLTDRAPAAAGSWLTLDDPAVTLAPGEHRAIGFTVRVPSTAKPGQWVAGVVAETTRQVSSSSSKTKAGVRIRIRDLTIVAVQVDVPGPSRIAWRFGKVTTGGSRGFQQLLIHMRSAGNVLAKPSGRVTVRDAHGHDLQTLPISMDTFLPQTAIDYPVLLKKELGPGSYVARVRLLVQATTSGRSRRFSATIPFSVSNRDVKQVFSSAAPTQTTSGGGGSVSTTVVAAAAGAGVAVLLAALGVVLLLRRRGDREPRRSTSASLAMRTAPPESPEPGPERKPRPEEAPPAAEPKPGAEPEPQPEPEPEPKQQPEPEPEPKQQPEPAAASRSRNRAPKQQPEPEPEPEVGPGAAPRSTCGSSHFWEVDYEQARRGDDGVWRFPHRCRDCGLAVEARDISDASAQAAVDGPSAS